MARTVPADTPLGAKLRQYAKGEVVGIEPLARQLEFKPSTFRGWIKGPTGPDSDDLRRLVSKTGISAQYWLDNALEPIESNEDARDATREAAALFQSVSPAVGPLTKRELRGCLRMADTFQIMLGALRRCVAALDKSDPEGKVDSQLQALQERLRDQVRAG